MKEIEINLPKIISDAIDKGIESYNKDMVSRKWDALDTFQIESLRKNISENILQVIK